MPAKKPLARKTSHQPSRVWQRVLDRVMPRHAPFYFGIGAGTFCFLASVWLVPPYAVSIGANAFFITYMVLAFIKLPVLTADYLQEHARDEDTPSGGLFLVVVIVVVASVVSLFVALSESKPELIAVILSVASVLLGWFTIQAAGAFHYAYEYYQAPDTSENDRDIEGGLDFPGDDQPDGTAFMYFSYTVGTSVATSDTKVTSNAMRQRLVYHIVFSHLYNTIILAAAVNVVLTLGSGG